MNNSFRYSLGKIIAICPQCGRRCFKPYVDNSTGRPLDVRFCGRCNRENSCQYHLTPSQWFHDNGVPHHGVATWTSPLTPRRWTPPPPPPPPSFIKLPPTPELRQFEDDPMNSSESAPPSAPSTSPPRHSPSPPAPTSATGLSADLSAA